MALSINEIAKICYAANRAYCQTHGDVAHPSWQTLPGAKRLAMIRGVGLALEQPEITPEQLHRAWVHDQIAHGWIHGKIKDAFLKTHPNICSWESLRPEQQEKDRLFLAIVRTFS
jgi:hypothetical protein